MHRFDALHDYLEILSLIVVDRYTPMIKHAMVGTSKQILGTVTDVDKILLNRKTRVEIFCPRKHLSW